MRLALENLILRQGAFTLALDAVWEGSLVALCGPSGSGKTTLLEVIAGLRAPSSGRVVLDSRVLHDTKGRVNVPARRRGIGYVPQDLALFPHRDVKANLLYGRPERACLLSVEAVCSALEITPLLSRMPGTLSGGEMRRVALGRALLAEPELLLLDEPLSNLDEALKQRILSHLLQIRDEFGIAILYVTHCPPEIREECDALVTLENGTLAGGEAVFPS